MTLIQAKELLSSHCIEFTEMEFASEADFYDHILPFSYAPKANDHKLYALIIQSNNGNKHITLEFIEKKGEYVFSDLWFGAFTYEYLFDGVIENDSYSLQEIQEMLMDDIQAIIKNRIAFITVTNPKTKQLISDSQFDRSDADDAYFGEKGFQRAIGNIRKKPTLLWRLLGIRRQYEIYDWNSYECITK